MLKNSKQTNSEAAVSPSSVVETTTLKPRKKLSFKEPEIFNYLKLKKPFKKSKPSPLQLMRSTTSVDFIFDENPFEEENDDLEELEVKVYTDNAVYGIRLSRSCKEKKERGATGYRAGINYNYMS